VNTALASAASTIGALFFAYLYNGWRGERWVFDFGVAMNGSLAGLVAITGPCAAVEMWAAICIGLSAGVVYVLASRFTLAVMKIDDPLDATAVHFFCGMWGLLCGGAFANPALIAVLSGNPSNTRGGFLYPGVCFIVKYSHRVSFFCKKRGIENSDPCWYKTQAGGDLLACQLVEIACILAFVSLIMTPIFLGLHFFGLLRISNDAEEEGLDSSVHGGSAQPEITQAFLSEKRSVMTHVSSVLDSKA